ncbi:acyl carrier protein [Actinoplanes teichomyceticus]|uniref:Phosphopantetheine binding protein n=1 Tax=Actinoplanes teichomyceticus TaxID=1867 RepID=A0A561WK08_ACTTI|nr:acyl carrier protein [Actinoplanes teichomyceticus]TWG24201.1 phosphopantetheine binding protein [Actinoplanes teichomyceticus]GIF12952.1 hypothetical protein Ate01nite_29840 [Actinoplanes teichomyceticus]
MSQISVPMIIECVRKAADKEVAADTDIFSAGVDSLAVLRCRALLKEQTGVKVPGHVFFGGRTPAGIVAMIDAQSPIGAQHVGR